MLQEIAARPNVTARVAVIDKVPPSLDEDAISKLASTIMEALPTVEKVMQDRFHVGHHVSKHFNNADTRFYALVIHGWREATVTRDSKFESAVDEALRAGTISKQRKHRGIRLGQKLNDEEIRQLKASGEYHNLFSAKECIVPEIVKDADTLRLSVARWKTMIIDACFHPPDADGKRRPILINGANLVSSIEMMEKIAQKALKRILHCIPPSGVRAWRPTGQTDANGFEIYQSLLHTCGVESWNGQQPDFVCGSRCSKELATGCFLEGNATRIVAKAIAAGEQEDLGTSDVRRALSINRWAGHGGDASMVRLMHLAPLAIRPPTPKADAAVCIQPLGRLDARTTSQLPSSAELERLPGAPRAHASLPPQTVMALPRPLAVLTSRSGAELMLRMQDDDPEKLDVSQLDSPISQRHLAQAELSADDSPGLLQQVFNYMFGSTSTDQGSSSTSSSSTGSSSTAPVTAASSSTGSILTAPVTAAPWTATMTAAPVMPLIVPPPISNSMDVPPIPMSMDPPAAKRQLELMQAPPEAKRPKNKGEAKNKCMKNKWWCICRPVWPAQGRQWHAPACPRDKWARAYDANPGSAVHPTIGDRVTALSSAGPRAGRMWEYRGLREGWVEITSMSAAASSSVVASANAMMSTVASTSAVTSTGTAAVNGNASEYDIQFTACGGNLGLVND